MFKVNNLTNNDDIRIASQKGGFTVIEYLRDLSVFPSYAATAYFCDKMNVRKRQVICNLADMDVVTQKGAMQWSVGNVEATTGIKGAGDLLGKAIRGKATGESAVKPEYKGDGILVLEPTYKHILLVDLKEWGGGIVLDDGIFLACDNSIQQKTVMRSNFSSAVAGGEGLFNLCLTGSGIACLECMCPEEELITIELNNDVLKVDGNMAVAWSPSLSFTTERSSKSIIGSGVTGDGLVNVYRGTGKVLLAPVDKTPVR